MVAIIPCPLHFTGPWFILTTIAVEEARDRQDSHVGTEHLLLALLKEREGIAMKMLRELGLTSDAVRGEIYTMLGAEATA